MSKPPFAKINFGRAAVDVSSFEDGSMVLRAAQRLEPYPRSVGAMLEHWARETPEQTFLAERAGDGWRAARASVRSRSWCGQCNQAGYRC